MPLLQLGPYPIEREVGRGGMGVVYLGRDTRLGRPVAIKVLPDAFARDPERLARFEREARLLASLTHPNIAGIYGLEEADGRRFLALEYVEGETLAERLQRGPLPLDEAIDVCRQIASALEAAHEAGIVHRDLKPGNVKRTPSGDVKVLDFGLAKGGAGSADSISDLTHSPTIAIAATGAGVILGTAAYMSPEQARGRPVDRRTDIWSFGCVLYECLTGEQAFAGETVSDMIARILQGEPDVAKLPAATPERLRVLLARCLEKDAKRRLRDIGEARIELEALAGGGSSASGLRAAAPTAAPAKRRSARFEIGIAIGGAILAAVAGVLATRALDGDRGRPEPMRFTIQPPPGTEVSVEPVDVAISPDGRTLAFVASDSSGLGHLWVRPLGTFDSRMLDGTRGAAQPFWSPDGEQLAYFAEGQLRRIRIAGGDPEIVCTSGSGRGGCWTTRGDILFSPGAAGPILRVRAGGGTPVAVTVVDTAAGESSHRSPNVLPDGRHFTYVALPGRGDRFPVWIGSVDAPDRRDSLMQAESAPVFSAPGHLLFRNNDAIQAQRFDANARRLRGDPLTIAGAPTSTNRTGMPAFSVSTTGVLAWIARGRNDTYLAWVDRAGREQSRLQVHPDRWLAFGMSGDQRRVGLELEAVSGSDAWVLDLERETTTRLTSGSGGNSTPTLSYEGRLAAYSSTRSGRKEIYVRNADGSGDERRLYGSNGLFMEPTHWTRDGSTLLVQEIRTGHGWDLMAVSTATGTASPLLATPFNESAGFLTQDDRWMVYQSDESGTVQTWLCAYPSMQHRQLVSRMGSVFAAWSNGDREIVMLRADGMLMSIPVTLGSTPRIGTPTELWRMARTYRSVTWTNGSTRFLAAVQAQAGDPGISIATDWRPPHGK